MIECEQFDSYGNLYPQSGHWDYGSWDSCAYMYVKQHTEACIVKDLTTVTNINTNTNETWHYDNHCYFPESLRHLGSGRCSYRFYFDQNK